MIIKDHISLLPNPLIGPNLDELGPRFPDMSEAYSKRWIKLAKKIGEELNIKLQHGVYVGVTGPSYETPSEYRMYHILGADAVGMSTVPETIVARYLGMEVLICWSWRASPWPHLSLCDVCTCWWMLLPGCSSC